MLYSSNIYLLEGGGGEHVLKRLVPLRWRWSLGNRRGKHVSEVCPGILRVTPWMWCNGEVWNLHTNYLPHPPIIPFGTHQNSSFFMYQIVMVSLKSTHFNPTHPPIIPFGTHQNSSFFMYQIVMVSLKSTHFNPTHPPIIPFGTHQNSSFFMYQIVMVSLKSTHFNPTHPPIIPFGTHQNSSFFMYQIVMVSLKSTHFNPTHPRIIPFGTQQISRFFMYWFVMARNSMKSAYQPHPPFHYSLHNTQFSRFSLDSDGMGQSEIHIL